MKKIFLLVLLALVGIGSFNLPNLKADEARTIPHKFIAYTESTAVTAGKTIYRITGVATANNAVFGIYNTGALGTTSVDKCAVEGGEATSGDALPMYDFGDDGLTLDAGSTVVISGCTIIVEYI